MEDQIKASLIKLMSAINSADGQTTVDEMARLDEYVARGRTGLNPQLVHFLQNRSYAKALQLLGGDTRIPGGTCGGRRGNRG